MLVGLSMMVVTLVNWLLVVVFNACAFTVQSSVHRGGGMTTTTCIFLHFRKKGKRAIVELEAKNGEKTLKLSK